MVSDKICSMMEQWYDALDNLSGLCPVEFLVQSPRTLEFPE